MRDDNKSRFETEMDKQLEMEKKMRMKMEREVTETRDELERLTNKRNEEQDEEKKLRITEDLRMILARYMGNCG